MERLRFVAAVAVFVSLSRHRCAVAHGQEPSSTAVARFRRFIIDPPCFAVQDRRSVVGNDGVCRRRYAMNGYCDEDREACENRSGYCDPTTEEAMQLSQSILTNVLLAVVDKIVQKNEELQQMINQEAWKKLQCAISAI